MNVRQNNVTSGKDGVMKNNWAELLVSYIGECFGQYQISTVHFIDFITLINNVAGQL